MTQAPTHFRIRRSEAPNRTSSGPNGVSSRARRATRWLVFAASAAWIGLGLGCDSPEPTAQPGPMEAPMGAAVVAPGAAPASGAPIVELAIGFHRVRAEVANTLPRRRQGLSGRPSLAPGEGMIFPYDPPEQPSFWMPDMHFDIDILWIRQGKIIDLHARVPTRSNGPFRPTRLPPRSTGSSKCPQAPPTRTAGELATRCFPTRNPSSSIGPRAAQRAERGRPVAAQAVG